MNLEKDLILAQNLAIRAGKGLSQLKERLVLENKGKDIKLEADKFSESIILEELKKTNYNILSEETPEEIIQKENSDMHWIVDPLDGSFNFYRGIPHAAVSISLWKGLEPLLGVVYDIHSQDLYSAIVGGKSELNGKRMSVSEITDQKQAVLMTGIPSKSDFSDKSLLEVVKRFQDFKKVRYIGSAALSLSYVASGKADVYSEKGIMLWDVAAGLALVKAAGGRIDFSSMGNYQFNVLASNGKF